jgi:hypothetical protein
LISGLRLSRLCRQQGLQIFQILRKFCHSYRVVVGQL